MLRRLTSVALVAFVLLALFAGAAFAQVAPAPAAAPPSFLASLPQWLVAGAAVLVATGGVFKAVAFLLGLAGSFWPKCLPAAAWCAKISTEFHTLGTKLGDTIPGSNAAKMRGAARRVIPPAAILMLAIGFGTASSGCAALSELATSNPVVVADSFEHAAEIADDVAVAAFNIARPFLPAVQQAAADAAFAKAQAAYHDAMTALNDAVKGYQDGTSQNWTALYADVVGAIDAVVAAVDEFASPKTGSARDAFVSPDFATARAHLGHAVATVHRYH